MSRFQGNRWDRPHLTVAQILEWADEYHAITGRWPSHDSGPIRQAVHGETWGQIDSALNEGFRGLLGGLSLARLLQQERGLKPLMAPETMEAAIELTRTLMAERRQGRALLSETKILAWADAYHEATGRWPTHRSGPVAGVPGETWSTINRSLIQGRRGLPGGSTLARLLVANRGRAALNGPPELTIEQVLAWADAHHAATGDWPSEGSGPVRDVPGEDWQAISSALYSGCRGLSGGSSLARLLDTHRPERLRILTLDTIRGWAEAYRARHGLWPAATSGPVAGAPGEDWRNINAALRLGRRGLPGGTTLARQFGPSVDPALRGLRPRLTLDQVLAWGDAYHAENGQWPRRTSGPVAGRPGERWVNIDQALRTGVRGLPAGLTLTKLFASRPTPQRGGPG